MTSRFKISSKLPIPSLFDPYFSLVIVFFSLQLRNIDNEEVKISAVLAKKLTSLLSIFMSQIVAGASGVSE